MKVTPYTVRGGTPPTCARCAAKMREGEAAEAVLADGWVEHRHATCTPPGDGAKAAATMLATIRQEITHG